MTHNRVYCSAKSVSEAISELRVCSGKQFDPYIVREFINLIKFGEIDDALSIEEPRLYAL